MLSLVNVFGVQLGRGLRRLRAQHAFTHHLAQQFFSLGN